MNTRFRSALMLLTAFPLAACAGGDDGNAAAISAAAAGAADTPQPVMTNVDGMQGRLGMQNMPGMGTDSMMQKMQSHVSIMEGAGADSLKAMLPMHRQMVANMISKFGSEMGGMNMADTPWQATIDSLRRDNIRMPELSASELRGFVPEHRGRIMRLMEMHRSMMGGTK